MIQKETGRIVAVYRPEWKTRHQISCLTINKSATYMALGTHQGYIILCKSQNEFSLDYNTKNNFNNGFENGEEPEAGTLQSMIPSFLLFDNFHCPLPVLDCIFIQWNYLTKNKSEQYILLSLHQGGILKHWDLKSGQCIYSSQKFIDSKKSRIICLPDQRFSIISGDEYIDLYDCWKDEVFGTLAFSEAQINTEEFNLTTLTSVKLPYMIKFGASKDQEVLLNHKCPKLKPPYVYWLDKNSRSCTNDDFKRWFYSTYKPYMDNTSFENSKTEPLVACLTNSGTICCWNLYQVIEAYLQTKESDISVDRQICQLILEKPIENYNENKENQFKAYIGAAYTYSNQDLKLMIHSNPPLTFKIAITSAFLIANAFKRIMILRRSFGNAFEPLVDLFCPDEIYNNDSRLKFSTLSRLWSGFEIISFSSIPNGTKDVSSKSEVADYKGKSISDNVVPNIYLNILAWTNNGHLHLYKFSSQSTPTTKGLSFSWKVPRALMIQLNYFPNLTRIEPIFDTNVDDSSNSVKELRSYLANYKEAAATSKSSYHYTSYVSQISYRIYFVEHPKNQSMMSYTISLNEFSKAKLLNVQDIWDLGFDCSRKQNTPFSFEDSTKSNFFDINHKLLSRAIVGVFALAESEIFLVLSFIEGYVISINLSSVGSNPQFNKDLLLQISNIQTLLDTPVQWSSSVYNKFSSNWQALKVLPTVESYLSSKFLPITHRNYQQRNNLKIYSTLKCIFNNFVVGGTTSGDVSIWILFTNEMIDHFPECHLSEVTAIFVAKQIDELLDEDQLCFGPTFITVDKSNHYALFESKMSFEMHSNQCITSSDEIERKETTNKHFSSFSMKRLEHFVDSDHLCIIQIYLYSSNDLLIINSSRELFLWRISSGKFLKRISKPASNGNKVTKTLYDLHNLHDIINSLNDKEPIHSNFGNLSIFQTEEMKVSECFPLHKTRNLVNNNNMDELSNIKLNSNTLNTTIQQAGCISILILNVNDLISSFSGSMKSRSDNFESTIRNLLGILLGTANTSSTLDEHTKFINIHPLRSFPLNRASIGVGNSLSITLSAFPIEEIEPTCGLILSGSENIRLDQKIKPHYLPPSLIKIFSSHDSTLFAIVLDILCRLSKKKAPNIEESRSYLASHLLKHIQYVDIYRLAYNIIESNSELLKTSSEYLIRNYFQNCLETDLEHICENSFNFTYLFSQNMSNSDQLLQSFSSTSDLRRSESNIKTDQQGFLRQKSLVDVLLVTLSILFYERQIYFRKMGSEVITHFLESLVLRYLSDRNDATNFTQLLCGLLADICEDIWDFNFFTEKDFIVSLKSSFRESQKDNFGEALQYPLQGLGWFVLVLFRDYRNILLSGPCGRILNAIYRRRTSSLIKIIGWICRSINISENRSAALLLLLWLADREPKITYYHLTEIVDTIVKCLDPINVEIRKGSLASATAFFFHLVKKFSMVAVHQSSQRLAIGNHSSLIIIFDLRTSAIYRVLEGHTGPISALSFIDDGDGIVSYCSQDRSIRTWKTTSSGVFGDLLGFSSPTVSTLLLPSIEIIQNFKPPERLFNLIRIKIINQKEMILQREDEKTYKIRFRQS